MVEIGIAEQNLVGVAAGLASAGKKAFAVSPACFLTARALEQIKNDVAYSDNPVKLIGISAGVSYGALGSTHHSLHDYAVLRAINNITIVAPADNYETAEAIKLAAQLDKPIYLRFGKKNMPDLPYAGEKHFQFGKGRVIRNGIDMVFIATGETVFPSLRAAEKLEQEYNIHVTVISMHTIKPLDYELIAKTASSCQAIITVEEHSVNGGLGEACASFLLQEGFGKPFKIIGIPDEYTVTGSQNEIFNHYGISAEGLTAVTLFLLFAGCKTDVGKDQPKKVAVIISTLNNPWFVVLAQTAAAKAQSLGYEAKIFDSQNNTSQEADNFDNAILSGYNAILFNPTDAEGSITNVLKAKAAGVPVFCMDREVNSTDAATSQILSDNYSGCVSLGKYFVERMQKKGNYVEILGMVGDNNTWNRSKGFHSVVDRYPGLKMVAQQSADFDRNKAMEVMESILQAQPDIQAVFCGNDAMASGAYQALVAAGKANVVKVFGFDGAEDVINSIRDKKILATGMQFPKVMAQTAAVYADEYFKGKSKFPQKMPVAVELVTQENVSDYMGYGKKEKE